MVSVPPWTKRWMRDRCLMTCGDGIDCELGASVDVAAHEDVRLRGLIGLRVCHGHRSRGRARPALPSSRSPHTMDWPMDMTTWSQESSMVSSSSYSGAKRLVLGSKTRVQRLKTMPVTWPSHREDLLRAPSAGEAHAVGLLPRQPPLRRGGHDVSQTRGRASRRSPHQDERPSARTSMATLPPPTTTTFPLTGDATPRSSCSVATSRRKSTATVTALGILARNAREASALAADGDVEGLEALLA